MPTLAQLAAALHYAKTVHPHDRAQAGPDLVRISATEATALVREHLAQDGRLRNVEAAPYGALVLRGAEASTRLEPCTFTMPKGLTRRQAEDLALIARAGERARLRLDPRAGVVVQAGPTRIPPAATERLVERGWLATSGTPDAPVSLSVAAVVALEWHALDEAGAIPAAHWPGIIAETVVDVLSPEPAEV